MHCIWMILNANYVVCRCLSTLQHVWCLCVKGLIAFLILSETTSTDCRYHSEYISKYIHVFRAIYGLAPLYLMGFITQSMAILSGWDLRSILKLQLILTSHWRQFAKWTFAITRQIFWNVVPLNVRDAKTSPDFHRLLKEHCVSTSRSKTNADNIRTVRVKHHCGNFLVYKYIIIVISCIGLFEVLVNLRRSSHFWCLRWWTCSLVVLPLYVLRSHWPIGYMIANYSGNKILFLNVNSFNIFTQQVVHCLSSLRIGHPKRDLQCS